MKKILLIFTMLFISTACFAQKANVNKAKSKSEVLPEDKPDFDGAIDLIEAALTNETTKNDPKTWWVAANIYDKIVNFETQKPSLGLGNTDKERQQESAYKAYDYYLKAVELEKIPDAKGKTSDTYTKKAKDMLSWYFNSGLIISYGATSAENEEYDLTIKAFEKHLSIPDLPFIAEAKGCPKKEDCPKKEKNDSLYWNIKYYEALYTHLNSDKAKDEVKKEEILVKAILKYEQIKDKGYRENDIYQLLYSLYRERKDTVNMLKIIDSGIVRFPQEFVYIAAKIDYLIDKGQEQQAIAYLQQAIERDPKNAKCYYVLGDLYSKYGKRTEGMKNLNKAIDLEPSNAVFWLGKGNAVYEEGKEIETASITTRDAKTSETLNATAKAKFKEAEGYFLKALDLDDTNRDVLEKLRNYYYKINDTKKYNEYLDKIKNL